MVDSSRRPGRMARRVNDPSFKPAKVDSIPIVKYMIYMDRSRDKFIETGHGPPHFLTIDVPIRSLSASWARTTQPVISFIRAAALYGLDESE